MQVLCVTSSQLTQTRDRTCWTSSRSSKPRLRCTTSTIPSNATQTNHSPPTSLMPSSTCHDTCGMPSLTIYHTASAKCILWFWMTSWHSLCLTVYFCVQCIILICKIWFSNSIENLSWNNTLAPLYCISEKLTAVLVFNTNIRPTVSILTNFPISNLDLTLWP